MPQISVEKRLSVYARDDWTCVCCRWQAPPDMRRWPMPVRLRYQRKLTLDHIVPKARGGTNAASNLQTMCDRCNNAKGSEPSNCPRCGTGVAPRMIPICVACVVELYEREESGRRATGVFVVRSEPVVPQE